jgi:hypothetical protein
MLQALCNEQAFLGVVAACTLIPIQVVIIHAIHLAHQLDLIHVKEAHLLTDQ